MNTAAAGNTRMVPDGFGSCVPRVRRLLEDAGLNIVEEFDLTNLPYFQIGIGSRRCTVLLVDMPVLLFEAVALDRAAAVFLPIHVVICGDRDTSYVHWANPMVSSGLRPPSPSKEPLDKLCSRVTQALSRLPDTANPASADRFARG
jgi:uncharacterized protein (DUF302 family)